MIRRGVRRIGSSSTSAQLKMMDFEAASCALRHAILRLEYCLVSIKIFKYASEKNVIGFSASVNIMILTARAFKN